MSLIPGLVRFESLKRFAIDEFTRLTSSSGGAVRAFIEIRRCFNDRCMSGCYGTVVWDRPSPTSIPNMPILQQ